MLLLHFSRSRIGFSYGNNQQWYAAMNTKCSLLKSIAKLVSVAQRWFLLYWLDDDNTRLRFERVHFHRVDRSKSRAHFVATTYLKCIILWINKFCRDSHKWEMQFPQDERRRIKSLRLGWKMQSVHSVCGSVCHNHFSFSLQSSKDIKPNEVRGVTRAVSNYTVDLFNAASMRNAHCIIRVSRRITVILRDKPLIFIRDRPSWDSASVICREGDH